MNAVGFENMRNEWKHTALKNTCLKTSQWKPRSERRGDFYYIDVSAVSNDTFKITSPKAVNGTTAPGRARKIVHARDVIYATIRPTLHRIALVPPEYHNHIVSTAFCVVRADRKKAVPEFLYFLLLSDEINKAIADSQHGASYPAVTDKDIFNQEVSLPSLSEQKNIAALLLKIQRAIQIQEKIIQSLRDLKKSTMQYLFTHGLHGEKTKMTKIGEIPESWSEKALGDIANISAGGTPSRANPAYWQNGTIPWVKTGEINYRAIATTEEHITEFGLESSSAKLLSPGTLLLAMYGQGITRGRVGLLSIEAATNQACAAIIPMTETISTRFLYHYLTWSYDHLRSRGHGAQQANLSAKIVAQFPVIFPSTDEQVGLTTILDSLDSKAVLHESKKSTLQDLFKTILNKLMTGEIRTVDLDIDVSEVAV